MSNFLDSGAYSYDYAVKKAKSAKVDDQLMAGITSVLALSGCRSVADMGCGAGHYVAALAGRGHAAVGFDGTPGCEKISRLVQHLDLSKKRKLGKKWDAVLAIEVGQFIPPAAEKHFIGNLVRHAGKLVIVTWAQPGKRGDGHVNQKSKESVRKAFEAAGFQWHEVLSKKCYGPVKHGHLRHRIQVFTAPGFEMPKHQHPAAIHHRAAAGPARPARQAAPPPPRSKAPPQIHPAAEAAKKAEEARVKSSVAHAAMLSGKKAQPK